MTGLTLAPARADRAALVSLPPILEVRDLRTCFETERGTINAVDGVTFDVAPGETLGIVGESGSGKSITALSIMNLLQGNGRVVGGSISFRGRNTLAMNADEIRQLRGGSIAMVFQDPMTSLNPVLRIETQLIEAMLVHGETTRAAARQRAIDLLRLMGITDPERALGAFPHQFSGGMRQRIMLAMSFLNKPALLIADEPTTALDVTIQAQILDLLKQLNAEFGTAVMLISHDLGVIANICNRVVIMYAGEIVEQGPTAALLARPKHPYTWALLNAAPRLDRHTGDKRLITIEGVPPDPQGWPVGCRFSPRCPFRISKCDEHPALLPVGPTRTSRCWVTQAGQELEAPPRDKAARRAEPTAGASVVPLPLARKPILEVRGLVKHFAVPRRTLFGKKGTVHAVDGVDFTVHAGETVGLVGESGCGKSTLARVISRLYRPNSGSIVFQGNDITAASGAAMRPLRRRMQMIFQDPYTSLNPRMRVGDILSEPLRFHDLAPDAAGTKKRVSELLGHVGLPSNAVEKYPHEFSGGQRQRISIARALAVEPDFIVADEPISSLDVNIQAQIINLLIDLQERMSLTYLLIAHDLAVVRHVSDRIIVLYLGKVMETASASDLFDRPLHPYTRSLLSAVPIPDVDLERRRVRVPLKGETPSALAPPSGCRFRTRCPHAQAICAEEMPALVQHGSGQWAACHFAGQI